MKKTILLDEESENNIKYHYSSSIKFLIPVRDLKLPYRFFREKYTQFYQSYPKFLPESTFKRFRRELGLTRRYGDGRKSRIHNINSVRSRYETVLSFDSFKFNSHFTVLRCAVKRKIGETFRVDNSVTFWRFIRVMGRANHHTESFKDFKVIFNALRRYFKTDDFSNFLFFSDNSRSFHRFASEYEFYSNFLSSSNSQHAFKLENMHAVYRKVFSLKEIDDFDSVKKIKDYLRENRIKSIVVCNY